MSLSDKLKAKGVKPPQSQEKEPFWTGPCGGGDNGGLSFSLLSKFLTCRERFRIKTVLGLSPAPTFNPAMDYGNMWHVCEEAHARSENNSWLSALQVFCRDLVQRFPTQQSKIGHWYEMCKAQFPVYVEHWKKFDHGGDRTPLLQEHKFDIEYILPSKRMVRLRGKWDSVDQMKDRLWLQENKTKSQIDMNKLSRQLPQDLQTMLYIIAIKEYQDHSFWNRSNKSWRDIPIAGVRYNVIRRSAHKTPDSMLKKIQEDQGAGRIAEWFTRWETRISEKDIKEFQHKTLNGLLETVCLWWEWVSSKEGKKDPFANPIHWQHPFGVRNIIDEGGATDLDYFIETGSTVGLTRSNTLFPELQ